MVTPDEVFTTYASEFDTASPEYERLYEGYPSPLAGVFATMQEQLNEHFKFMNSKMRMGRHFNAEDSRQLIQLIKSINELRRDLKRAGIQMALREDYAELLETCRAFLLSSGGSPIPDDMPETDTERFEPIFGTTEWAPKSAVVPAPQQLVLVGEGSFAFVHRFVDDTYGISVAVKRAKPGIAERDLVRFRKEFEVMKELDFPYIVRAYAYDATRESFTMEFCDETLGTYIQRVNQTLSWSSRKRIGLQFLYGLNYLHTKSILHRDISRNNVLVQHFDRGAVLVKLSDFGLHKHPDSDFTAVTTELKGSIIDPTLNSFKDFAVTNDIYAAGVLISYIFSGRIALGSAVGAVGAVVQRSTDSNVAARYETVAELIRAIEALEPELPILSGESPA
ncbi:protein kinase family protein [Cryobacterium sp. MDB2-10]|uniref:protein kinase family protein n=1 Tax=Cryobacterium sp. MDB2-10 TaxID=1259177 RepID=UPI0010730E8A|nr:protein kinase family protein [Cryobacterium sp. MDB2-10]TFC12520.1 protein kinase family protein [Cryobacterium sp. MDB2-10]